MSTNILVAIISGSVAIIVAAFSYWSAKEREREAEWRKEKLGHYKEFITALASSVGSFGAPEAKKRYAIAFNTVGLFASHEVITRLHEYQEVTRLPAGELDQETHDSLLSKLVLAIRKDLKLKPKDEVETFKYLLIEPNEK
ncbi:hypothetical protein [Aurantivibrio plasticivorans]